MASFRGRHGEKAVGLDSLLCPSASIPALPHDQIPSSLSPKERFLKRSQVRRIIVVASFTLALFAINQEFYGSVRNTSFYGSAPLHVSGSLFQTQSEQILTVPAPRSDSAACRVSFLESFGTICVPEDIWSRILAAERKAWSRIEQWPRPSDEPSEYTHDGPHKLSTTIEDAEKIENVNDIRSEYLQNVWVPTFSCPEESRVGGAGAGGKWVCGARTIAPAEFNPPDDACLIYSLGNDDQYGFEATMSELSSGACEIHIFNRSKSVGWMSPLSQMRTHSFALGKESQGEMTRKGWGQLIAELGHQERTINILKIDCEGCELDVIPEILSSPVRNRPQQILIEMHLSETSSAIIDQDRLLKLFREAGYRMYHMESNYRKSLDFNYSFFRLNLHDAS